AEGPELLRVRKNSGYREIIGSSSVIEQLLASLDRIVATDIPVWIKGESGTGKELIARALHFKHPLRRQHPFITENCSAIPENLFESLLFGHVKGAFTHAERDSQGLFQSAHRGTIFLDEVGDLPFSFFFKLSNETSSEIPSYFFFRLNSYSDLNSSTLSSFVSNI
ncbi:MAG: sigma 54-interacting transcriptional regulator, partial [Romboutsia sp.]|nr:sigma 54-interacting transcriptional regulator [Romboutsia sp.]